MFYLLSFKGCGFLLLFFRRRTHVAPPLDIFQRLVVACRQGMCFGVVQLGVVMFCFSKYFLHRFFFLSFQFNSIVVFYCTREKFGWVLGNIPTRTTSGLCHSAAFPNFDGLINGSSNDIGMRSMEV